MGHTYVMSDIHGMAELFKRMLEQIRFRDDDTLYSLGDMIDRGPDPAGILDFAMSHGNVIALKGNHEDGFVQWYESVGDKMRQRYYYNTYDVLEDCDETREKIPEYVCFMKSLPLYRKVKAEGRCYLMAHASTEEILRIWKRKERLLWDTSLIDRQTGIPGYVPGLGLGLVFQELFPAFADEGLHPAVVVPVYHPPASGLLQHVSHGSFGEPYPEDRMSGGEIFEYLSGEHRLVFRLLALREQEHRRPHLLPGSLLMRPVAEISHVLRKAVRYYGFLDLAVGLPDEPDTQEPAEFLVGPAFVGEDLPQGFRIAVPREKAGVRYVEETVRLYDLAEVVLVEPVGDAVDRGFRHCSEFGLQRPGDGDYG